MVGESEARLGPSGGGLPGPVGDEAGGRGSPAIQVCFSRFRGTVQHGPVRQQETQIVQSELTLDDFLPGLWLPPVLVQYRPRRRNHPVA